MVRQRQCFAPIANNRGKAVMLAAVNWSSTNVGVLLVTSTYTPNADHNLVTDITNEPLKYFRSANIGVPSG